MTLPVWTNQQILAQLDSGFYWTGNVITYDFPTTTTWVTGAAGLTFAPLTAQQQTMATLAITLWGDLIAPTLQLITQTAANPGNIDIAAFTAGSAGYAFTYFPTNGTAWFNDNYNGITGGATNDLVHPTIGKHGFATFVHELGHAFGLNHAGNYNAGNGTPEPTNYFDSTMYSIMSYFGPSWGDGTDTTTGALYSTEVAWANWTPGYDPQTPMLNDIMAIQAVYGVSTTTRTGNTVYGFHSNITGSEAAIYDFTQNAHPILCIFDSSGNDTLDLSGFTQNAIIDLHSGAFSSCAGMTNNISIAYTATIENAVGGSGNDILIGNDVGDTLNGGAGADTITGGAGNDLLIGGIGADTLNGGAGINTASYVGSTAGVTVDLRLATAQVSAGDASGDILSNIQNLTGSSNADTLIGNGNANTLNGGLGDDILVGGAGADTLIGGGGSDTASYAGSAVGVTVDLRLTTAQVSAGDASGDILSGIANLTGSAFNDMLLGDANANVLTGNGGNDYFDGNGGNDTIVGGAGNDTIVFHAGLLSANVNMGGGADVMTIADGTLPTGFNLVASSIESAVWTQHDLANNQTWSTITSNYNSSWQIQSSSTLNHDSSTSQTAYDYTVGVVWQQLRNDYNPTNQVTATHYLFDDNSTRDTAYDYTAAVAWASLRNDFNVANQTTYTYYVFDNGTSRDISYDYTVGTIWQTLRQDYDAGTGARNYLYYVFDNGTSRDISVDTTNTQVWTTLRQDYDASGARDYLYYVFHDGSSRDISVDTTNTQVWQSLRNDYDAGNHLTYQHYLFHDATARDVIYDVANLYAWTTETITYDAAGNVIATIFA